MVVLGRGAKDSFMVALYRSPTITTSLASSLLLVNDEGRSLSRTTMMFANDSVVLLLEMRRRRAARSRCATGAA